MSTHLPHQTRASDHSPMASSKADPLLPFPGCVNLTTGRCGESCFQQQRCVGSSIKGDREFAVPIRASLSKPGAGRIKAQSHLPANPRQECFLSGIVFFSSLQARSAAPTPTRRTGSRTLVLAGLDTPTSPRLSINPTSKGPTYLAVMQVL